MKRLYNLVIGTIFSCSLFLNAELPGNAAHIEQFEESFNQSPDTKIGQVIKVTDASECESDTAWVSEYVNLRTAVSVYLPYRTLINAYIVKYCLNKKYARNHPLHAVALREDGTSYSDTRPLNFFPITRTEAICLPINAITYIAGIKLLDNKYPLKKIMAGVAISSVEQISESLVTHIIYKYLPKVISLPASGKIRTCIDFAIAVGVQKIAEYPVDLLQKKLSESYNKQANHCPDKDRL